MASLRTNKLSTVNIKASADSVMSSNPTWDQFECQSLDYETHTRHFSHDVNKSKEEKMSHCSTAC